MSDILKTSLPLKLSFSQGVTLGTLSLSVEKLPPRLHLLHAASQGGGDERDPQVLFTLLPLRFLPLLGNGNGGLVWCSPCRCLQPHFPPVPPVSSKSQAPDIHNITYKLSLLLTSLVLPVSMAPKLPCTFFSTFLKSKGITFSVLLWSFCRNQGWFKFQLWH